MRKTEMNVMRKVNDDVNGRKAAQARHGTVTAVAFLLLAALPLLSQVTVVSALSYSSINSNVRQFRMYYPTGTPVTATLPIVAIIHGGGWYKGGYSMASLTPTTCKSDQTIACWLADHGYVVFSIDYTLVSKTASGSDLMVSGTNTVTAGSYVFQPADVGSRLLVISTSGGWHAGGYSVVAVKNGAAQLDASPGTAIATHGLYALLTPSTLWPVQWQDCNCFLRYLAEQAGVSVPGDPHNIVLMGHSAGAQLGPVAAFSGNDAFPTNCDHTSVNYRIKGVVGFSPPTDLVTLYPAAENAKGPVRDLLGCIPGYGSCNSVAMSASIVNYVAENLPPYMSFSGANDTTIPPANAQEAQRSFANLKPPVSQQWIEFGPAFGHALDIYFYADCASGNEPSPCGSAGSAFQTALPFIQSVTSH
jgi:acetyl esterase/lipase